jgi:hypothetical protein
LKLLEGKQHGQVKQISEYLQCTQLSSCQDTGSEFCRSQEELKEEELLEFLFFQEARALHIWEGTMGIGLDLPRKYTIKP